MKSKIYKISKEEMKEWLNNHSNMNELFNFIGFRRAGGNFETVQKFMDINNLQEDYKKFRKKCLKEGYKKTGKTNSASYEELFVENSAASRKNVKRRIIQDKLLEYKCSKCGNIGEWNGEKLVLQLDHINGIYNDNRLENLRFLCPNCHSQTETFCGLNNKKIIKKENNKNVLKKLEQNRWEQLEKSNIDFSKFGWVKELSALWHIAPNKAGKYVKKHYPSFYEEKCFTRL